ncbi:MAG: hypothetical protein CL855_08445 [Cryomorphaceae bacterium]|nr:hypothetical protein [Cryomorphaceae bacterium]
MAEQVLPIDPPIVQKVDGVDRAYKVLATVTKVGTGRSAKNRIKNVRVYPVDSDGNRLKGAVSLYTDGLWSKNQITNLTDQQQNDIHKRIQNQTKKLSKNTNATLPAWAKVSGSSPTTPPSATATESGLASGLSGILDEGVNKAKDFADKANKTFGQFSEFATTLNTDGIFGLVGKDGIDSGKFDLKSDVSILGAFGGYLRYPVDMNPNQDSLKITCFRYRTPYGDSLQKKGGGSLGSVKRNSPFRERLGSIELPMPSQGIVDSTSAAWEVDYMNDITMAAAQHIGSEAGRYIAGAVGSKIPLVGGFIGNATKFSVYGNLMSGANKDSGLTGMLGANVLSMLGSNLGFDIGAEQILSRGGGIVSNSNAELLFRGVKLRRFNFAYRLIARSQPETRSITMLIRAFKQWGAPRKLGIDSKGGDASAGSASWFLGTPNVFQLSYMTTENGNRAVNKFVHKFKPCALTNFSVNYAANNQWMAYESGAPVTYNLNFEFSELEPVYNTDFTEKIPSERDALGSDLGDLMPIGTYDVGY